MENKTYNFLKICRCCLKESVQLKSLFVFDQEIGESFPMHDIIKLISTVEIFEGDGLPEHICIECMYELKRTIEFCKQILDSDMILRKYQINIKNDPECEVPQNEEIDCEDIKTESDLMLTQENKDNPVHNDIELEKLNNKKKIKKPKQVYACDNCDKTFSNKKLFTKHRRKHENISVHKCHVCSKQFRCHFHLKLHMRWHVSNDEKPFVCQQCGQQYIYQYQLTQHMNKHLDKKPFPCPKCDKGCLTAGNLRQHMRIHNAGYKKSKHMCQICQKKFSYPSFLAKHMKGHTGEKQFLCSYCGKGFKKLDEIKNHFRIHTDNKPFQCDICKNSFTSQNILKVHMRSHTDKRPYACNICGRTFKRSKDMNSHMRSHTEDKTVLGCLREKNSNRRIVSVYYLGQLTIHMRMHTGEKPFS